LVHQSKRVLVIDEESWWRDLLQNLLAAQGVEVNLSNQLDQGLTEAGKMEYDIVLISDRVLDDPTLKMRLESLLRTGPGQQIVLVSAAPGWQRARELFLLGVADCITKSVEADEILSALTRHL
jgi:two-component system cell cycle response regulator